MADETQSVITSLRLPGALRDRLRLAAARERRSVNNLILVVLEEWLDEHEM